VHLAGAEAHSVVAGPEGIEYLAFGTRARAEYAFFPRLKAGRIGMLWAEMIETHQWTQELALGDPELPTPSPRPPRIVNIDELEEEDWGRGDVLVHGRDLGIAAGSVLTGINYNRIEPGMLSAPPHCHSVEEEIFIILDGMGTALLGDEEHSLHRGHVVARPAATRIPHAFRAGEGGLTMLAYGTRERGRDLRLRASGNLTPPPGDGQARVACYTRHLGSGGQTALVEPRRLADLQAGARDARPRLHRGRLRRARPAARGRGGLRRPRRARPAVVEPRPVHRLPDRRPRRRAVRARLERCGAAAHDRRPGGVVPRGRSRAGGASAARRAEDELHRARLARAANPRRRHLRHQLDPSTAGPRA